jgi:hypothetical protein
VGNNARRVSSTQTAALDGAAAKRLDGINVDNEHVLGVKRARRRFLQFGTSLNKSLLTPTNPRLDAAARELALDHGAAVHGHRRVA